MLCLGELVGILLQDSNNGGFLGKDDQLVADQGTIISFVQQPNCQDD